MHALILSLQHRGRALSLFFDDWHKKSEIPQLVVCRLARCCRLVSQERQYKGWLYQHHLHQQVQPRHLGKAWPLSMHLGGHHAKLIEAGYSTTESLVDSAPLTSSRSVCTQP